MNEFLKNLRSGTKDKRLGTVRAGSDRRVEVERRVPPQKRPVQPDTRMDEIEKSIANIESALKDLTVNLMQSLAESFKLHIKLEERKISLLEKALPYLENLLEKSSQNSGNVKESLPPAVKEEAISKPAPIAIPVPAKKTKTSPKRSAKRVKESVAVKKMSEKQRKAILDKIYQLRRDGKSFEQITKILVDEKLPTLSNRGQWHAQTVHRLCRGIDTATKK
ncbi:recombinase family protein [Desulfococcaceae bacterium OttesenSCG-928-F15]|nr:recombinase family protein [Desulfococcaceae bacterium OttesenSCG-928-F15]